jgi:hypothetical protein
MPGADKDKDQPLLPPAAIAPPAPVMPEQVNEANAPEMGKRLLAEIKYDQTNPPAATIGPPTTPAGSPK